MPKYEVKAIASRIVPPYDNNPLPKMGREAWGSLLILMSVVYGNLKTSHYLNSKTSHLSKTSKG